jgi:hypothetical protein
LQNLGYLALREQVQSRDVFDLKLLLDSGAAERPLPATAAVNLAAAIDNALAVEGEPTLTVFEANYAILTAPPGEGDSAAAWGRGFPGSARYPAPWSPDQTSAAE